MFGKKLKIKDYKFTFGKQNEDFNVFGCFKYRSNYYAIYQDVTNPTTLYYGTCHISKNILVVLALGKNDSVVGIQNFITKLYNGEDLSDYQILSLANVEKIEIISYNSFSLKEEVITKLIELTIPKDVNPEKKKIEIVKKGHPVLYVCTFFLVCLSIVGFIIYLNRDSLFGRERTVICTKQLERNYNADIVEDVTLYFDKSKQLTSYIVADTYTFDNDSEFENFALTGKYYHVFEKVDSEDLSISSNVAKKSYRIGYKVSTTQDYFGPRDYNQALEYYTTDNYDCKEVEKK